jgi:hypothetical protein
MHPVNQVRQLKWVCTVWHCTVVSCVDLYIGCYFFKRDSYIIVKYYIQHTLLNLPSSKSAESEDAGIEPRTIALAVRRSHYSARSHQLLKRVFLLTEKK